MKEIKLTWIFVCKLSKAEFEWILSLIPISFLPLFVLFIWNKDLGLIISSSSFLFVMLLLNCGCLFWIKEKLKLSSNILLLFLELLKLKEDNSSSLFFSFSNLYIFWLKIKLALSSNDNILISFLVLLKVSKFSLYSSNS